MSDVLQQILSCETSWHELLDDRVKRITNGDDFAYRYMMTLINMTRAYGQIDGMTMLFQTENLEATLDHITAELFPLSEKMEQLKAEAQRTGRS